MLEERKPVLSEERADPIAAANPASQAGGTSSRSGIGTWVIGLVPIETLVPEDHAAWRTLVRDAIEFVFSHLSEQRLAAKIQEQIGMPANTPPEMRLIRLISKMPGLQKMGQVLARNRRLAVPLREALCHLENGMSDVTAEEMRAIITQELGPRLDAYGVEIEPSVYKEGSASAILMFTWRKPEREREPGAFKVLKPYVPQCFAEDMTLLQGLGEYLAARDRSYRSAVPDVQQTVSEVRQLLEHELEFTREQATLIETARMYRSSIGIRVPRLIQPLCTGKVTAMSAENGVKVTDVFPQSPLRRESVASQVVEALLVVPLFSREPAAVFHGDPHAGNLLYDEPNRELIVLDWALSERLSLAARRRLVMLAVMTLLRKPAGVSEAICGLALPRRGRRVPRRYIESHVNRFFAKLPEGRSPGVLDAMMLLDDLALRGVRFPSALFLFRKALFTLDGVLEDVAGKAVRIDQVVAYQFLTRCVGSFGFFHEPLNVKDLWPVAKALIA